MENKIMLSVIVPAYNASAFLVDCIESLINQGFPQEQYEIIIVNDGSVDNTEYIIDDFASRYSFIKKITTTNQGVSKARNAGIRASKGKYLAFVDSDDCVSENSYYPIIEIMEENSLDAFYFDVSFSIDGLTHFKKEYKITDTHFSISAGKAIYLKELIVSKNIFFDPQLSILEDFWFNYLFTWSIRRNVGVSNQKLYYYRSNPDSVTRSYLADLSDNAKIEKTYNSIKRVCKLVKESPEKYNIPRDKKYDEYLAVVMLPLLWFVMRSKMSPRYAINDMKKDGLYVSQIKVKVIEGTDIKFRLKSELQYLFRFRPIFFAACAVYRILPKKIINKMFSVH